MLSKPFPNSLAGLLAWNWPDFAPLYDQLTTVTLTPANIDAWLRAWTDLENHADELYNRTYVAVTCNTADKQLEERFDDLTQNFYPRWLEANQHLKQHLLASGLQPAGFEIPLRNMRAEADLFRKANLPLLSEEHLLSNDYERILGAQTAQWDGEEVTVAQLKPVLFETDRARRESAWRAGAARQLLDRESLNDLWQKLLALREKIAANAGHADYRAYMWQNMLRFDYTPADALAFHSAIEAVVVPAASRIYARRRELLGVDTLRPWDLDVDPLARPPLRPAQTTSQLNQITAAIFHRIDPQLGAYFDRMISENLLDLENRKNKAPGGYCLAFQAAGQPFIFANNVGVHEDAQTLFHEGGHAFHVYESAALPYYQLRQVTSEMAEVASMGMEFLADAYLEASQGGFYTTEDARRAHILHLEGAILFWPYMAVVDAFQHWVYTNPQRAADPAACDATWGALWQRFMPGVDWTGLEDTCVTGWQRKEHIFTAPLYYIEYGLAQLGAAQVWMRSLDDSAAAVRDYRTALALGGSRPLPELYQAAGARLAFDAATLGQIVSKMESMIQSLE